MIENHKVDFVGSFVGGNPIIMTRIPGLGITTWKSGMPYLVGLTPVVVMVTPVTNVVSHLVHHKVYRSELGDSYDF